MKKGVFAIILLLLAIVAVFAFTNKPQSSLQPTENHTPPTDVSMVRKDEVEATPDPIVDIKATFAIFTNGTFRIFTATMYHNLSEDIYIEGRNPNRVTVKKRGTTWNDFFTTLPFKLSKDCLTTGTGETFCTNAGQTLKFYLNGITDDTALTKEIQEGDTLLVSYGAKNDPQIQKQLERLDTIR
ncbi:MAG: hypothetical protein AAB553_07245 [Patescibacteria group bacterium]